MSKFRKFSLYISALTIIYVSHFFVRFYIELSHITGFPWMFFLFVIPIFLINVFLNILYELEIW